MKVKDLCTRLVRTCSPDTSLASAGWTMWEADCGFLPIVDEQLHLLGVLTDRDICMAVATRYRPAAEITAREVCGGKAYVCRLEDDVKRALEIMRKESVRRLPVVDAEGRLEGVLSLNDIVLAARSAARARANGITYEDLVPTMQAVCAHRIGQPKEEPLALPAATRVAVMT